MSKKYSIFDVTVEELLRRIDGSYVHFFAKDLDGRILMANDIQADYCAMGSPNDLLGRCYSEFVPKEEMRVVSYHDMKALHSNIPQIVHEVALGNECICIKGKLEDSSNNIVGSGGVAFYLHQMPLEKIVPIVNDIVYKSYFINSVTHSFAANSQIFNRLTVKERECVYYLSRGMGYKEIAVVLNISRRTVESHIANIKEKLGCYKRSDIINKIFEGI